MRVVFSKGKRGLCTWTAYPAKRRPVTGIGGNLGRTMPHDLLQFLVERELGHRHGFWGCMADGATFLSLADRRGRGRPTAHGRSIISAHLEELNAAEGAANREFAALRDGVRTTLTDVLEGMRQQWIAVPEGGSLELVFTPLVDAPPHHPATPKQRSGGRRQR